MSSKNAFSFKFCATYLKFSRAFGANIGELISLAKHAIENIFYVEKTKQKVENICSKKNLAKKRHAAKNFGLTPLNSI